MIKIICVGKIKEQYLRSAISEYEKRLKKFTKLEIIEVNDESNGNILEKEKNHIIRYINDHDYVVTLEIDGNMIDSVELSKKIDQMLINFSNITFVIGGSYGLSDEIKKRSNYKLSFSKMTFPHQLMKLILVEQDYRAYKIMRRETYHK